MAVTVKNYSLIGISVKWLTPEIKSESPLARIQLCYVKFIRPNKLPFPSGRTLGSCPSTSNFFISFPFYFKVVFG